MQNLQGKKANIYYSLSQHIYGEYRGVTIQNINEDEIKIITKGDKTVTLNNAKLKIEILDEANVGSNSNTVMLDYSVSPCLYERDLKVNILETGKNFVEYITKELKHILLIGASVMYKEI